MHLSYSLHHYPPPPPPVFVTPQPLSDRNVVPDDASRWQYTSLLIPLSRSNASLVNGTNYVAAEVHVSMESGWDVAWGMRLSASTL